MPYRTPFLSRIFLIFLIGFSLVFSVRASPVMWSQTYGGPEDEEAHALVMTSDGGMPLPATRSVLVLERLICC